MTLLIALAGAGLLIGVASRKGMSSAATAPQAHASDSHQAKRVRLAHQLQTLQSPPAVEDSADPAGQADDAPEAGSLAMHPEPEERFVPRPPR